MVKTYLFDTELLYGLEENPSEKLAADIEANACMLARELRPRLRHDSAVECHTARRRPQRWQSDFEQIFSNDFLHDVSLVKPCGVFYSTSS
jgi:hypothetical protein